MDAAAPKGERIAVDNAKFEQFMFYTLRKTAEYSSDDELVAILTSDRCHYAILTRERYERMRVAAPIAGLAILAEGRINGRAFVLVGHQHPRGDRQRPEALRSARTSFRRLFVESGGPDARPGLRSPILGLPTRPFFAPNTFFCAKIGVFDEKERDSDVLPGRQSWQLGIGLQPHWGPQISQ
jgi:hypothetical protein